MAAFEGGPLAVETLSDPVRRATAQTAPAPLRMMAARGLAPMSPRDQVTALYQLSFDADEAVRASVERTAVELPDKILVPALGEALAPAVLDFLGRRLLARRALLEAVLLHAATPDDTVIAVARQATEELAELIATNEARLLRAPALIAALYNNPKTRMSTADRVVELAVRNGLRVEGIAAFDEAAAALLGAEGRDPEASARIDQAFAAAAAVAIELPPGQAEDAELAELADQAAEAPSGSVEAEVRKGRIEDLPIAAKIRMATVGNAFARAILIRDSKKQVALAVIKSPALTDNEVVKFAASRGICDEVISHIARSRELCRLYQVKMSLVNNPKCPVGAAVKMLQFLQPKDLKRVGSSKGVSAVVAAAARKLATTRGGG